VQKAVANGKKPTPKTPEVTHIYDFLTGEVIPVPEKA
jgi:hypothetical protein